MGRSGCWTGFLCLGSLKRGKRIVPATRMHDGSNHASPRPWASNGAPQSGGSGNQYATHSPSLLAPPSSPASFQNSAVQSSAQSPCSFPVVSVSSATSQIPLETAQTMFQMGPYAHETALVSPPVFSNFTTAPSTAPFTPPPELASHLTTPSSPDVPFAQLLANSFGVKQAVRSQPAPTYSPSPFASPDIIFSADDLQAAYQLYPGSPLAHLLSPASGTGASTPFPDLEPPTPVHAIASMFFPGSPLLLQPDRPSKMELEVGDSYSSEQDRWQQQQGEQQLLATISSFLACADDSSKPKVARLVEPVIVDVHKGSFSSFLTCGAPPSEPKNAGLLEPVIEDVNKECSFLEGGDPPSERKVSGLVEPVMVDVDRVSFSSFLVGGDPSSEPKVVGLLEPVIEDVHRESFSSFLTCGAPSSDPKVAGLLEAVIEDVNKESFSSLLTCGAPPSEPKVAVLLEPVIEDVDTASFSSFLTGCGPPSEPKVAGLLEPVIEDVDKESFPSFLEGGDPPSEPKVAGVVEPVKVDVLGGSFASFLVGADPSSEPVVVAGPLEPVIVDINEESFSSSPACGDPPSERNVNGYVELVIVDANLGSDECQTPRQTGLSEWISPEKEDSSAEKKDDSPEKDVESLTLGES